MQIKNLSLKLVKKYAKEICESLDQIKLVEKHTLEQLLAEQKGERLFHAKWSHSLIALTEDGEYVGVAIAYEREAEGNKQYPVNSIYFSDLAIDRKYQGQGLGKELLTHWLELNKQVGFTKLTGNLVFSLQTNSAFWNQPVQKLYESFGFRKTAEKVYENRVDNVYFLS